jgi:cell division protein FtsB
MNGGLSIWHKLTRVIVLLVCVATLLLVVVSYAVWYLPLIEQNERMRRKALELDTQIQQAQEDGKQLKLSADTLRRDPKALERLIRERMGYARTDETVVRFEAPATNAAPRP